MHSSSIRCCVASTYGVLLQPPKALKRPKTLVGPNGDEREDPYYWLRDDARTDPEIRAHLEVWLATMSQLFKLSYVMFKLHAEGVVVFLLWMCACWNDHGREWLS